jgi:ketosteroid isomerase-like protein
MSLARFPKLLAYCCALVACGAPKVDMAAEVNAVRARSEAVSAAEAAKDREKALTFWTADAIVQPAGAPQIQGREAIDKLYRQIFDSTGLKTFSGKTSTIVVSEGGDLAYETGVNQLTFGTPKGDVLDVGKYLIVWKKTDGVWSVAAISFTSDAAAPVPVAK